jgi:Undecaprenyl-phosphate glucose phosphotransferase
VAHRPCGRFGGLIAESQAKNGSDIVETMSRHGLQMSQCFILPDDMDDVPNRQKIIDRAISSIRGSDTEEIVVSSDLEHWSMLKDLLLNLRSLPLPIHFVPIGPTVELFKSPPHKIGETVTIELQRGPRTLPERFVKRLVDIAVASVAMTCLLPLFLLTAIAIKLDSSGPVIFRQRRCGFNGRQFTIFKFRTMSVLDDGDTIVQATPEDDRITRVGRWLRRTSVDELPQLFNVLQGSMSIVGPRPHAVAHDNQFEALVGKYAYRQHTKPGITGWAQVNGHRGLTRTIADIEQRVALDLWYVENWSLALDFRIVFMTVIEVLRGENAY